MSEDKKRTFCVYDAPDPEAIRRTAERNALPVDRITKVSVLSPPRAAAGWQLTGRCPPWESVGSVPGRGCFIVGTALERDGLWTNRVDPARAAALRRAFDALPMP